MSTKKPLLTISLLISNRPDTIPRCLDSLRLLMDKLPCELILIDTSKSKEIHNLLLTYTDQVYEFEWCKDFAKARNEGVRRAKGEWFMYLDDDEWLVDVDEIVAFFKGNKHKNHQCANIQIRNFLNLGYTEFSDSWGTRMFYLGGGAKFEGKVHEYIYPIYGDPCFLQALAYHSGYVFDSEEKKKAHYERNTELLLSILEEDSTDLRAAAHLVQEYRTAKEWDKMIERCKIHLKNAGELKGFMTINHFCTMYAGLVEGLTRTEKAKEAIEICNIGLEDERSTDLLKAWLYFYKAQNHVELKEWEKARENIELYFKAHEHFEENKEEMRMQLGALLVHRIFEEDYVEKASNVLIFTELKKENIEIPLSEDDETEEVSLDALSGVKFVRAMIKLIASMEYNNAFEHFLNNLAVEMTLCEWACAEAQQKEKEDEEGFRRVAYALSKVESNFWYINYCRIMEADSRENKEDVEKEIEALLMKLGSVCYMPDRIYEIIDKYDIKIATIWNKIAGRQWMKHITVLVNQCEDQYIDKAYDYVLDVYGQDNWRAESLPVALMEKQVKEGMNVNVLDYHNLLCDYAERKLIWYYYFCEEYGMEADAPAEVRAAAKIKDYAEAESQDVKLALTCLKEAAALCPDFANGIAEFFQFYSEIGPQRETRQREDMRALRTEVMEEVNDLIKKGEKKNALQIIEQLNAMIPDDLEVAELLLALQVEILN